MTGGEGEPSPGPTPVELSPEIDEDDERIYRELVRTELTAEERERVVTPGVVDPRVTHVLGLHWHPEFIPLDLIRQRLEATFPRLEDALIIPTQHNELLTWDGFTGAEVDCYSPSFARKVQLLFHFGPGRLDGRGDVFRSMVAHTQKYRAGQLFEFIDSLLEPRFADRRELAAGRTGADADLVAFVQACTRRLKALLERHEGATPRQMIKNKLLRGYFDALRARFDGRLIHHAQLFLKAVKQIVKENFALEYFYHTREVVEEGRALGAGIVIPHPEQFWPILLDELDVDGIEVWNPQSFQYTQFLIDVVNRKNSAGRARPLIITMGDDCHFGEKVRDPAVQDRQKACREVGVQPAWDDLSIRKRLIAANTSRQSVITEYRDRLR